MAQALGVSSTLVSLIFKGEKSLTPDQASALAEHQGLTDLESDYLHLLVEFDRAGTHRYKQKLLRKISEAQKQSRNIGKRVLRDRELSEAEKAVYYSSWMYTAVRNLSAIPALNSVESLARHLKCEPAQIQRAAKFLLAHGLCVEESGKITHGPASIHVDRDSHFVNQHHRNWRQQGMQVMDTRKDMDLFFTSPMSLSQDAAAEIRKALPNFIQSIMKIVGPSRSQTAACLNIDWFEY